jgi:hypothetical protein
MAKEKSTNDVVIEICNQNMLKSKGMLILLEKIRDKLQNDETEAKSEHNKEVFRIMKGYVDQAIGGYEFTIVSLVEILNEVEPKIKKNT